MAEVCSKRGLVTSFPQFHHRLLPPNSLMSHEQAVHDRINLYRLVRRLEKSVADEGWRNPGDLKDSEPFPHAVWIRTQGTLGVSPISAFLFSRRRPECLTW